MKNIFWVVTILLSPIYLPTAKAFEKGTDTNDLQRFADAIGGKSIVVLDELTHGEEDVFQLKTQLIQYLHKHKGFNAIVFESGLFDMAKIWQSKSLSVKQQASGNLFYMYANSPSVQQLLEYLDKQRNTKSPLILAGFDGRLSGHYSKTKLVAELTAFLKRLQSPIVTKKDWQQFINIFQLAIERKLPTLTQSQIDTFNQQGRTIVKTLELQALTSPDLGYGTAQYFAQLIKGVLMVANQQLQTRRFDENDLIMASNLKWLMDNELQGKKVIIWGHFIHVNKYGFFTESSHNAISLLRQSYPNDIFVTHFSSASGLYRDFITGEEKRITLGEDTIEYQSQLSQRYAKTSSNYFYLGTKELSELAYSRKQKSSFNGIDYNSLIPAEHWPLYWDGMFVLKRSRPSP